MKIMSLGRGFISNHLPYEKMYPVKVNISNYHVSELLDCNKPNVVINCIGKTGRPNVDWCESHKQVTSDTNTILPIILADECLKRNIHLVQIGSGCVYAGPSPQTGGWKEDDWANPQSFYARTKYASDLILATNPIVTNLRIRMPISNQDNPRNLINKLKGYKQVIDIPNSVTFIEDLVRCVDWVCNKSIMGTYHVVNPAPLTGAQVMNEYRKYVPSHEFEIITGEQLDKMVVAKRSNCILNTEKLQQAGFRMTSTEEALSKCMKEYIGNIEA